MSDDLLDAVRGLPKVCPYLHVPAQSGCNDVLRAHETALHGRVLSRHAGSLPGEGAGRRDQQRLHRRLQRRDGGIVRANLRSGARQSGFKNSYIFKYSPRPGTKGHELLTDDMPEEVKKRRNNDLLAMQNAVSLSEHVKLVGRRVEVLVEGPSKNAFKEGQTNALQMMGRTRADHIVVFPGTARLAGSTVEIDVKEASTFTLFGTVARSNEIGLAETSELPPVNLSLRETQRFKLPLLGK